MMFKEKLARKLMEWFISSYSIKEVISTNTVKLKLLVSIRIHPIVKFSRAMRYKKTSEKVEGKRIKTSRDG